MDHYGIGSALKAAALIYFQAARGTGRTTSLLQSLKNGDQVAVLDGKQAEHLRRQLRERNLDVRVIVLQTGAPDPMRHGTPEGRTLMDHTWVERYYLERIAAAEREIDELQKLMTGWGEAHEKTRRRAQEMFDDGVR